MSLQDIIAGLEAKLNADPSKMAGVTATYQFKLSGEGGGDYNVVFTDGAAQLNQGVADKPDITIAMEAADFKDLIEGKMDAMSAFMTGKLRVEGDMSLAMRLQALLG
ncbi:SCP2 sterol-binding domain-containing protein [Desulfallas thermosapovorans]|uniref:SCP-2 sterol transfer family protein n=1 Tax=Desulfallas thermosapovorans DSM 6562 TaxID=1121431 RepID=A0A5S4ZTC3_9FIRM|nr:SCP2 sterol-binding domain-containing protein [Desulfallas thermosapovorans]TYO96041.1 SCP-2 sterol transfer family protein [Desulfallas thermosapovorans DSM 6562]